MPKISTYYLLEHEILKYKIMLSNEELHDNGFSLDIENFDIYYNEIESASVETLNVKIFALYNSIHVENLVLSSLASSFFPTKIENLHISYSIFNPLNIFAKADGEFGNAKANFYILDKNVSVSVMPSNLMLKEYKPTLQKMTKQEDGGYRYDKAF